MKARVLIVDDEDAVRSSLKKLVADCTHVGIPPLTFHRLRDTFISLARRGGARKDVLERVTHNAAGDIIDRYTSFDWQPLCEAVSCLKISDSKRPTSVRSRSTASWTPSSTASKGSSPSPIRQKRTSSCSWDT